MTIRRYFIGLAIATILVMVMWPPGLATQAAAETLNMKVFNHVTNSEVGDVPDCRFSRTPLSCICERGGDTKGEGSSG